MKVFGPVPSRRLGRSLGVNNIPPKNCTYNCVYCQVGITKRLELERRSFYSPEEIYQEVKEKVLKLRREGEPIDYITFVPDGEPTLDINLGKEASLLKEFQIPLAVITNASLIWREDVREDLSNFDLVSLKVDAAVPLLWRRINRPHPKLNLEDILDGALKFRKSFKGIIYTETMLIDGIDYSEEIERIAKYLSTLNPHKAFISVPIRPPAERWVSPPKEEIVNHAYQVFRSYLGDKVELLINPEGSNFTISDQLEEEIISISSVHPIPEDYLRRLLEERGLPWNRIEEMVSKGQLKRVEYLGRVFYMLNYSKS